MERLAALSSFADTELSEASSAARLFAQVRLPTHFHTKGPSHNPLSLIVQDQAFTRRTSRDFLLNSLISAGDRTTASQGLRANYKQSGSLSTRQWFNGLQACKFQISPNPSIQVSGR